MNQTNMMMKTRLQSVNPEILETLQLLTSLEYSHIPECSAAVLLGENHKSKLQAVYAENLIHRYYFAPQKQMIYTIPLDIYINVLLSYPGTKHNTWCKYIRTIASFLNKAGQLYNMREHMSALNLFDLHRASIHDLLLSTDIRLRLYKKTTRKLTKAIEIARDMFHHRFTPEEIESIEILYEETMEYEEINARIQKLMHVQVF
jgi:phage pi2 protein 07